jgi:hypothetical protein
MATYRAGAPGVRYVLDRMLHVVFWSCIVMMTILLSDGLTPLQKAVSSDFSSFYQVGQMALDGHYPDAYDLQAFSQMQMKTSGKTSFFPWSYPPPVGLLFALLPMLPLGAAYALFTASTYLVFMHVLRALSVSADAYLLSRVVAAPAIIYNIICGQNGFLIGALIGFYGLFSLSGRRGGAFLGVSAVVKPHLVFGLGAFALINRRYGCLAIALAVVILSSLAATLFFGVAVWPAFLKAGATARELLMQGRFKSESMVTVFASLSLLGADATLAALGQALCAVAALGMMAYAVVKGWEARQAFGLAVIMTLCVSPYVFVYDFPALGVAVALLAEPIHAACGIMKKLAILALTWLAIGGLLINTLFFHAAERGWLNFSGFLFLLAATLVFDTLRKAGEA